jgi:hypothetical protein
MIALEIYINGEHLSLAGRDDLCVLTFFLDAGGACGSATYMEGLPLTGCDVSCAVNGASSTPSSVEDEALEWVPSRRLIVGDTVIVKITETDDPTAPIIHRDVQPSDPDTFYPTHAIAFEVMKNGVRRVVAGRNNLMMLSAVVSAVGTLGATSSGTEPQQQGEAPPGSTIDLHIVGKERRKEPSACPRPEWIRWETLVPGDELSFRILDTAEVDAPIVR